MVEACPGVLLLRDRPVDGPVEEEEYTVMHTLSDRHTSLVIPSLKNSKGDVVERTVWTLWTVAEAPAAAQYNFSIQEASMHGDGPSESRIFALTPRHEDDAATVEREADVAHYMSLGGLFDVLQSPTMSERVGAFDRLLMNSVYILALRCSLQRLPPRASANDGLAPLAPLAKEHSRMLKEMNIDEAALDEFRTQVLQTAVHACRKTLGGLAPEVFLRATTIALEQGGLSALMALHLRRRGCYVSQDMSASDARQLKIVEACHALSTALQEETQRLRLRVAVARVVLLAAVHDGNLGRALGIHAVRLDRADETSACLVCGNPVNKLKLAMGVVHVCRHRGNGIVCDACGGDVGCTVCRDRPVDWAELAVGLVCDNISMAVLGEAKREASQKTKLADEVADFRAREATLRRRLHDETRTSQRLRGELLQVSQEVRELQAKAKRERRRAKHHPEEAAADAAASRSTSVACQTTPRPTPPLALPRAAMAFLVRLRSRAARRAQSTLSQRCAAREATIAQVRAIVGATVASVAPHEQPEAP